MLAPHLREQAVHKPISPTSHHAGWTHPYSYEGSLPSRTQIFKRHIVCERKGEEDLQEFELVYHGRIEEMNSIEARAKAAAAQLFKYCEEYIAWSPHCESAPVRDYERIILSHFTGIECDERLREAAEELCQLIDSGIVSAPDASFREMWLPLNDAVKVVREALAKSPQPNWVEERKELVSALKRISSQRNNRYESTVGVMANIADEALKKAGEA